MRPTTIGLKAAMSATPRTLGWIGTFVFQDGTTIRVSGTGANVTFDDGDGAEVYTKDKSFKVSQLSDRANGDVPDGEITAPVAISDSYTSTDVFLGVFEGMQVTVYMIDYTDPGDGSMQRGPYEVSEIRYDDRGKIASFEVRGILQRAKQVTVEEISVGCRSTLGDQRPGQCRLPLYPDDVLRSHAYAVGDYVRVSDGGDYHDRMFRCTTAGTTAGSAPGYSYTITNATTDGSAVFTCERSWVSHAVVATVTSNGDFTLTLSEARAADGWFELGAIKWLAGNNAGTYNQVRVWTQSTARVQTWSTAQKTVQVGDSLEIIPGCDKTFATCLAKFDNTINNRGENLLPGIDFLSGAL